MGRRLVRQGRWEPSDEEEQAFGINRSVAPYQLYLSLLLEEGLDDQGPYTERHEELLMEALDAYFPPGVAEHEMDPETKRLYVWMWKHMRLGR